MKEIALDHPPDVSNVYIYISDALRWTALPDRIRKRGAVFKTVAAGCATMRSVSSILTGVNPPRHGVASWKNRLAEPTLFDAPDVETGFYNPAAGKDGGLSVVLDRESEDTLADIEPPFVYLERDQGGHAPYHGYTYEEMLSEVTHTKPELRRHYRAMVEKSANRFERRLEQLSERNLLDDTVVIFLGDHGELLGERGLVSHTVPPVPELVYVPTVFIHPEIDSGERAATIGHVDIVPTVLAALDKSLDGQEFDGVNLFESIPDARYNDSVITKSIRNTEVTLYHASGMWDGDGGHVWTKNGNLIAPLIGWKKARGWNWEYWKTNPREIPMALRFLGSPYRRHGTPTLSKADAAERTSAICTAEGSAQGAQIDDSVEEQLKNLGYRV
ncbi:MAG TPA: sulfatase-like hydrolase/transferase [Halococcus sp.]|nr:sulfatase-like hydrolase/transferase [Halococcus sp.]